jgi:spermidine synthase
VQPWVFIESATIEGGGYMELLRRGKEMIIRVDGRELMGTHVHGSEDALADLAFDHLEQASPDLNLSVLIGGLGIGFTLAAALKRLGPNGECVVGELLEAVVKWNDGPLGQAANYPLRDERAKVIVGDVAKLISKPQKPWDAIMLDVDNGPQQLTHKTNGWLYSPKGLSTAFNALSSGGVLGVWSAFNDNSFTHRMERAGFKVNLHPVRSRGSKGGHRHYIWIGIK